VCLGEDDIGVSGTRRADFSGRRDIWPRTARFGLANARPSRQSQRNKPIIGWMLD
jgi:hypothetical protein